jgi:hypothetical protein
MPGNTIVYEDAILRVAVRKNVAFAVWSAAPTVTQVHAFQRAAEQLGKGSAGHALMSVVVRGVPKFTEGVRDELVRVMKRELYRLGIAHLILLDGLAGAAVRAFLSTVRLLSRTPTPAGVFGSPDEAIGWVLDRVRAAPERWTQNELREALDEAIKGR